MVPSSSSGGAGVPAVLEQILHELGDSSSTGGVTVKKGDGAYEKCHRGKSD